MEVLVNRKQERRKIHVRVFKQCYAVFNNSVVADGAGG